MKCKVLVDWLTFSVKENNPRKVIRKYLGMDPDLFQDPGYGLLGYQKVLRFSDIAVCYEARENDYFQDMGVCVSMSGNGCRAFETMSKLTFEGAKDEQGLENTVFPVLFQLLAADETANISRIDLACDDREGYLNMDDVLSKVESNEINSRMTKRSMVVSFDGTQRAGATVYIGAPSSDFRIRIYDKALEEGVSDHWVRVELVMRGKNANAFIDKVVNSETVGKLAAQIINDKLAFIERDDSNITRCTVCGWWLAFVDEVESVRLVARSVIQHSVYHIDDWVTRQITPSLAVLFRTLGFNHIFQLVKDGTDRLSDKQLSLIEDFNNMRLALA